MEKGKICCDKKGEKVLRLEENVCPIFSVVFTEFHVLLV